MTEKTRPYAAVGNVMDVLMRFRNRNLPETLDAPALRVAGVPEGMMSRTLAALRFLGLLNEANEPTDEWRALSDVDDQAFPEFLGRLVRAAYSEVFAMVDPAMDGQDRIRNMFQQYQPKSQIDRMVTLFLGLCGEAGIPTRDAPKRRPTNAQKKDEAIATKPRGSQPLKALPHLPVRLPPPPLGGSLITSGESKTVTLYGGGTLTLHASARFFELPRGDRDFVFGLLDQLSDYENRRLIAAPQQPEAVDA